MPPTAAAAARRNRQLQRGDSTARFAGSGGGLLVTRPMPTPKKRSKKGNGSMRKLPTGQTSFRQKMMSQWVSTPVVHHPQQQPQRRRSISPVPTSPQQQQQRPPFSRQSSKDSSMGSSVGSRRDSGMSGGMGKSMRSVLCLEPPKPSRRTSINLKFSLSRGLSSRTAETFKSLETISDRVNMNYSNKALSEESFPIKQDKPQQFLIRRPTAKGEFTTIENQRGRIVGVVEETHYGRRLLKNPDGKVCAMILCHDQKYSSTKYSICGSEPVVYKQTMKYDQVGLGYYKWAHVKNAGGFGGTISLKHTKDEIRPTDYTYCTKMFGSVFRLKKTRGHVVLNEEKKECAKLIPLGKTGRAIQISPKSDTALMLCYAVIIDEILESRIR